MCKWVCLKFQQLLSTIIKKTWIAERADFRRHDEPGNGLLERHTGESRNPVQKYGYASPVLSGYKFQLAEACFWARAGLFIRSGPGKSISTRVWPRISPPDNIPCQYLLNCPGTGLGVCNGSRTRLQCRPVKG
jgi:hypothetical protein